MAGDKERGSSLGEAGRADHWERLERLEAIVEAQRFILNFCLLHVTLLDAIVSDADDSTYLRTLTNDVATNSGLSEEARQVAALLVKGADAQWKAVVQKRESILGGKQQRMT